MFEKKCSQYVLVVSVMKIMMCHRIPYVVCPIFFILFLHFGMIHYLLFDPFVLLDNRCI